MPPLPPDPYKILGVAKDAQMSDIRSAHRKLVLKCHPDKVQDAKLKAEKQDEFQQVQQAYELLSDDVKRRRYDEQVRLLELCKLYQAKNPTSIPRSAPKEFNICTDGPPPSPTARGRPPSKGYTFGPRWEDEVGRGPRIFDTQPSRREAGYPERPTKREVEREREKARDRDKDRERRRRQEESRRLEREAKEQRRAERKQRDKQRDKELRREGDDKKRSSKPYIESLDEPLPTKSDRKKTSGGKRYENRRDGSSGREEETVSMPPPSASQRSYSTAAAMNYAQAQSYIERTKNPIASPSLQRSKTYQPSRSMNPPAPPAPSPPPMQGSSSFFGVPDDRAGAKYRRASGDASAAKLPRERSHRAGYRDMTDEPAMGGASPPNRHPAQFTKSVPPGSPPRLHRSGTAPMDGGYVRTVPAVQRSQTMNGFPDPTPRGRERSRMHAQIDEESDPDDVYPLRDRDRKYRSGRRHHSPEDSRRENVSHYQVDGGRTKLQGHYTRRFDSDGHYPGLGVMPVDSRAPATEARDSNMLPKVRTSKHYGVDDVKYSNYYDKAYRSANAAYA
ncbi:hypothetical protein XA68_13156 [Ophiocordyceps unilateralis]|uniref:J domain-containing protein n=1 Tax=Ophiocordyceps unilateralis TaxID=268505 RepID=A0A2A9PDA1_OPHUN|nr:hypothetical protein XA68_13156 [Ophiocordyceps unilateralis]